MEEKLIYPKWIGWKAQIEFQIEFPKSPIKGQLFQFTDQSSGDYSFNIYVYTGSKWVEWNTWNTPEIKPKGKVKVITNRIKSIR